MRTAFLFLNGDIHPDSLKLPHGFTVCADGAYNKVSQFFLPDIVIGDFDSADSACIDKKCKIISYSSDKDFTDGHLAVEYIASLGFEAVEIFGAWGGRPDHILANISLLKLAASLNIAAKLIGNGTECLLLGAGKHCFGVSSGQTVSIVPFTDEAHILSTAGLKYRLTDKTLSKVHILGISNESTSETVSLEIERGEILIFFADPPEGL